MGRITAACLLLAACVPGEPAYEVDETGPVPVVRNHRPAWSPGEGWTVGATATLDIPQWSIAEKTDSFHLADAKRLPDGTFAIANGFTGEVAVFDGRGDELRRFGGAGLEPGRFQSLRALHVIDDAIWALDGMGRWNVFDTAGRLIATRYFEPHGGPWSRIEPYADEVAVLGGYAYPDGLESGRQRGSAPVLRYELTGGAIDTLAVVPGIEWFAVVDDERMSVSPSPFGPRPVIHGGERLLYYGSGDRMTIEVYGSDRRPVRIITIPRFDLSISEEEWAREIDWFTELERRREEIRPGATVRGTLEGLPPRDTKPAYGRFLEDADENLWVSEHEPAHAPRGLPPSNRWTVFDAEGRWLGSVDTPEGLALTEVGRDYVLGIARLEGRAHARQYDLSR